MQSEKIVLQKKFNDKSLSKMPIKIRGQNKRNACGEGTKRVMIIFYNK